MMQSDSSEIKSEEDGSGEVYPAKDKEWVLPKVPKDSEGFTLSFEINQVDKYKAFFEEFGFVVINNILSR